MEDITLDKIDTLRKRTGVGYGKAKEILEACEGNVVDALVYAEKLKESKPDSVLKTTKDDVIKYLEELVRKGNVSRIRIKKEDNTLIDIPVNGGIAVGLIGIAISPVLIPLTVVGGVISNIIIEITDDKGNVREVNAMLESGAKDIKDKVSNLALNIKDKISSSKEKNESTCNESISYTVKFDDEER